MPALMSQERLHEGGFLLSRREPPAVETARLLEQVIYACGAHGHHVVARTIPPPGTRRIARKQVATVTGR